MVHLTETMHLSCVENNTIPKWITLDPYHVGVPSVQPKWFLNLWYVWRKPRLTLSPNEPKQASTWHTLPKSTIWCAQNDFHACGRFIANHAPILRRDEHFLQTDRNELPLHRRHLGVSLGVSKMISKPIVCSAQTVHLSVPRLTLSQNGSKQASTWSCVEIDTISKLSKMIFHLIYAT
jgi:hypothetical protein